MNTRLSFHERNVSAVWIRIEVRVDALPRLLHSSEIDEQRDDHGAARLGVEARVWVCVVGRKGEREGSRFVRHVEVRDLLHEIHFARDGGGSRRGSWRCNRSRRRRFGWLGLAARRSIIRRDPRWFAPPEPQEQAADPDDQKEKTAGRERPSLRGGGSQKPAGQPFNVANASTRGRLADSVLNAHPQAPAKPFVHHALRIAE